MNRRGDGPQKAGTAGEGRIWYRLGAIKPFRKNITEGLTNAGQRNLDWVVFLKKYI